MQIRRTPQLVPSRETLSDLVQGSRHGEVPGGIGPLRGEFLIGQMTATSQPEVLFSPHSPDYAVFIRPVREEDFALAAVTVRSRKPI